MRNIVALAVLALAWQTSLSAPADSNLQAIHSLEAATKKIRAAPSVSEAESDEHASLVQAVAKLRDARAIPALIAVVDTGSMATDGLVAIGPRAFDALLAVTNESNLDRVAGALIALRGLFSSESFRGDKGYKEMSQRARLALEKLTKSPEKYVQRSAEEALAAIGKGARLKR